MIRRDAILDRLPWKGFLGMLEWSTGLLFINLPGQVFMDILHAGPEDWITYGGERIGKAGAMQPMLWMTLMHETYHYLQVASTGFLYDFACRYFREVMALMPPSFDEETIKTRMQNPPSFSSELNQLLEQIVVAGPQEIRVLDLVESSATLFQYRANTQNLTPSMYLELLQRRNPPVEYRHAYDVAISILGEQRAFDWMLAAVCVSLMFKRPQDVYLEALKALARLTPHEIERNLVGAIQYVAKEINQKGHDPMGSPTQVLEQAGSSLKPHPIYTDTWAQLTKDAEHVSPFELLANPKFEGASMNILRPLVFRDVTLLHESQSHLKNTAEALLILAALVFVAAGKEDAGPRFGCIL